MDKFQCHYKVTISWEKDGKFNKAVIKDPYGIKFNVSKAIAQGQNQATIQLYNIPVDVRENIYQDKLLLDLENVPEVKIITLEAGYGESLTLVCMGYVYDCYSVRDGVDFITNITVFDPDILGEYTSVTFAQGTTFVEAYKYLLGKIPNVAQGEIADLQGTFNNTVTFDGSAFICINKLTGGHTFIDNGVAHNLGNNSCLKDCGVYVINSGSGLLGSPQRSGMFVIVDMLFEPALKLGQLVEIRSDSQPRFNGQYRINAMQHSCTISDGSSGQRTTKLELMNMRFVANANVNLTSNPRGTGAKVVSNNKAEPLASNISASVQDALDYLKKTAGGVINSRINHIASWADMIGHDNQSSERLRELTAGKLANCEALANKIERFMNYYFRGKKVIFTSGWRSSSLNKRCGGVADSRHLKGRAVDIYVPGVPLHTVHSKISGSGMFYYSYVNEKKGYIHVDVGG